MGLQSQSLKKIIIWLLDTFKVVKEKTIFKEGRISTVLIIKGNNPLIVEKSFNLIVRSDFNMPTPFECKPVAYQVSGFNNSDLQEINLVTGSVATIKADIGFQGNAVAYNVQDNYLYIINNSVNPRQIYRICSDGVLEQVGSITNLPEDNYTIGTIDEKGYFYIKTSDKQRYYTIDLTDTSSTNYGQLVDPTNEFILEDTSPFGTAITEINMTGEDWAYNPIDRKIYNVNNNGTVVRLDPMSGKTESIQTTGLLADSYGVVYFDANGAFYTIKNADGRIFKMDDVSGTTTTAVDVTFSVKQDSNRPAIDVNVGGEEEGKLDRSSNIPYSRIIVVQPSLDIIKMAKKTEVAVGDKVQYTLNIINTGNVDVNNVIVRDLLDEKIRFISGSVTINGIPMESEDLLLGISIATIKVNEKVVVTFDVEVLAVGIIKNQAVAEYIYKSGIDGISQAGFNESNIETIKGNNVKLEVTKVSDKNFVILRDEVKYTVTIRNRTKVVANNIVIKDKLPRYIDFIPGTFRLNGQGINTVHLETGVNIGTLKPNQVALIEYKVKVVSNSCLGIIEDGVDVSYNYILPNGALGSTVVFLEGVDTNTIQMGMSNFKEVSIESYLCIPDVKVDIETINTAKGTIDIRSYHAIKTCPNISNEGQYLTGHKLIVSGCLNLMIEYTALCSVQEVHSAHYCIPFSTFVILPEDYTTGSKLDVQGVVEDVYYKLVNEREFFLNVTALINVKILFC